MQRQWRNSSLSHMDTNHRLLSPGSYESFSAQYRGNRSSISELPSLKRNVDNIAMWAWWLCYPLILLQWSSNQLRRSVKLSQFPGLKIMVPALTRKPASLPRELSFPLQPTCHPPARCGMHRLIYWILGMGLGLALDDG